MEGNVVIRRMLLEDIGKVAMIEKECFSLPWSEKAFEESLAQTYAIFFVAELKNTGECEKGIAGYVGVYHIGEECDITNVAVSPTYRRRGVATELLKAVEEYALTQNVQSVTLEVRESNTPAIKLYESLQYENIGIRKNFYEKPTENAIIMVRQL